MIFKHLPLYNRLKCKEVCQRWYELLMTRAIFRQDRHIYMNKCLIEPNRPPLSVFMNAKFSYDILTLDNGNIYHPLVNHLDRTLDFWSHLGHSIREIHIANNIRPALYKIFFEMPQLEVLVFRNSFEEATEGLFLVHDEVQNRPFLPSLKRFVAKEAIIEISKKLSKPIETLRSMIPKSAEIVIERINVYGNDVLEEILSTIQTIQVNAMMIIVRDHQHSTIKQLLSCERLPLHYMKFVYSSEEESNLDFLNVFLTKHANIRNAKIDFKYVPIPYPFNQLTKLTIAEQGIEPLRSFKVFEPLINLESIRISFRDKYCVFGHETVNLPKLQKLSMLEANPSCMDCITAMVKSFPSLIKFSGLFNILEFVPMVESMFKNWRYLKEMRVYSEIGIENLGKAFENFEDEQRLDFRLLEICTKGPTRHTGDDFLKMSKVLPHLNTLNIDLDETVTNLEDVVKGIVSEFKELISLVISGRRSWIPIKSDISRSTLDHIEKYGSSLRVRILHLYFNSNVSFFSCS